MGTSLMLPVPDYFKTLVKNYSVGADKNVQYLVIPDHGGIVPMEVQKNPDGGFRYTFHNADDMLLRQCMELNTTCVSLATLFYYTPDALRATVLLADKTSCIIEFHPGPGMPASYYKVLHSRVVSTHTRYISLSREHPIIPRFHNALRFERYQDGLTRSLNKKGVEALYELLQNEDKVIFNHIWRYGPMKYSDDQILPVALLAAWSNDPEAQFGMIPGCLIYGEDGGYSKTVLYTQGMNTLRL